MRQVIIFTMKKYLPLTFAVLALFAATPVLAVNPTPGTDSLNYGDLPKISDLAKVIVRITYFLLGISGGITILYIVIGGFKYMMAGGDPKAVATARAHITFAIIGLVVILMAVVIVKIIGDLLGLNGLNVINIPG